MKVKAKTNIKYGFGWYAPGEVFDAEDEYTVESFEAFYDAQKAALAVYVDEKNNQIHGCCHLRFCCNRL